MTTDFVPMQQGYSRVFIIPQRAGPTHEPEYQSCAAAGSPSRDYGTPTRITCPHPSRPSKFIVRGKITGSRSDATLPISARYAMDIQSRLLELADIGCPADVHVHMGLCDDLSDFDAFSKILVLEEATTTTWGTDDLGTLDEEDQNPVNETIEVSATEMYELLPLTYKEQAGSIITNEIVDGVVCDDIYCGGDCASPSLGAQKAYFVTLAAGGSPSTPADVVYTIDKGKNWYAHDVDSLGAAEDPTGIACLKQYIVVVSNDSNSLHYAPKADVIPTTDPAFTEVATGFVTGGEPNDIWSVGAFAFVVGDGGYVYGTSDPTGGVDVLDAGVATTLDLQAVHALDSNFAVAVGNSGAIVMTDNKDTWGAVTPTNANFVATNFTCVWLRNKREWWLGTDSGQVWYTLDGGLTFYRKGADGNPGLPGTPTYIRDIQFPSDSEGFIAHDVAGPHGRIIRSCNAGYSWYVSPFLEGQAMPDNDRITCLATTGDDKNLVYGGGLADNGTDGILVMGQD